jgi:hypothetical protein
MTSLDSCRWLIPRYKFCVTTPAGFGLPSSFRPVNADGASDYTAELRVDGESSVYGSMFNVTRLMT